ncbi:MAG: hypothetical protein LBF27_25680 [Sphingobacterium sp.]|nr:hypothetical protein [Sphingobacterium sp.]
MNNEKKSPVLTLEHLAPYLPYGLKVVSKINNYSYTLLGACKDEILIQDDLNGWYATNIFKPILRPLSELTKEIEHNGVSFLPLLLLAKVEDYQNNYLDDDESGIPIIGKDVSDFDMGSMTYAHTYRFRFDEELKLFVVDLLDEDGSMISEAINIATRNFDLIKKLYEWHFDVFGLIDQGLAIDINSIERKETNNG